MKEKVLKLIFGLAFLAVLPSAVEAAPVLFSFGSEEIIKVADFPNTEEFQLRRGEYVDAGYVYKQVTIFFIPVWNYDGRWAGYVGKEDFYLDFKKEELDQLANLANVKLPESPTLPFWHAIGGKIVIGLILLLYFGWRFVSGAIDEDGEPVPE